MALISDPTKAILERYWPECLSVVLALLVVVDAVHVKHVYQALPKPHPQPSVTINPNADPINAIKWFGSETSDAAVQASTVPLLLVGTLASTKPNQGLAVIGADAHSAKVYAVNDVLAGGARLEAVYADQVYINVNGVRQSLKLPRNLAPGTPDAVKAVNHTTFGASIQQAQAQPSTITELIKPMPQFENGHLKGFKVFAGSDVARFERLGLKAGDVITQVNNVPVSDGANGLELLKSLSNSQSAQVTIERDGRLIPITIEASALSPHHPTP
jgi:general secretion pathway protein C